MRDAIITALLLATLSACGDDSNGSRFVDNHDGTITDNQTGLGWEKKVKLDRSLNYANLEEADNFYTWAGSCSISGDSCQPDAASAAACAAGTDGDRHGCAQCEPGAGTCDTYLGDPTIWQWIVALNAANYGGHNDWRIPKLAELESLIDHNDATDPRVNGAFDGTNCGPECTDVTTAACSCTQSTDYWSASTYALHTDVDNVAGVVSFNGNSPNVDYKVGSGNYVRGVRNGP